MPEKTTWEAFFDEHAPIYEENEFTKNTVQEVDFLLEELRVALFAETMVRRGKVSVARVTREVERVERELGLA